MKDLVTPHYSDAAQVRNGKDVICRKEEDQYDRQQDFSDAPISS